MKKLILTLSILFSTAVMADSAIPITVYRSPTCSCCGKWIEHLKQNNFDVKEVQTDEIQAIKEKNHIPEAMQSCHTGVVNGYAIEGHVPADDIKELLKTKPKVLGLAVPEMPMGTPGMEMGDKKDAYNTMSFDEKNQTQVFKAHQ